MQGAGEQTITLRGMRTFYEVVANTLVATVTTIIAWFAITFWAYLQTNSVIVTTVLGLMYLGGNVLTGLLFGTLVDRYNKKTLMLVADAVTICLFAASFLLYINTPPEEFTNVNSVRLWVLISLVFIGIIIPNIRSIVQMTLVPVLVPAESLDRANGLTGMITGTSFLIGSLFSGFLVAQSGMYWALLLPIIVRCLTILHMWRINFPEPPKQKRDEESAPVEESRGFDLRAAYRMVTGVPGLMALLLFNSLNNFLGGVFMPLMDPYGLSMMSVEAWGTLSGILGLGFILGGAIITRWGLGENPLRSLFIANIILWASCAIFTIQPSIVLLAIGFFIFPLCSPFVEAAEHTIIQKVVPPDRQGRVFGFAQSIESAASPVSTLLVGPLAQFFFIPFMTTGAGVNLIGSWFGTGDARGIALLFTLTGLAGMIFTFVAMQSNVYRRLVARYRQASATPESQPQVA
jgi:MFS transporter, DHA3 family, multidrug efflux protein